MVIDNFDIFWTCIRPTKANSPLIVYTNAMLIRTIALERLKMITRWYP